MIDIELVKKAILLTQQGKIAEAREIYNNLEQENPDNPDLMSIIGLFYVNIYDFEKVPRLAERS